MLGIWDLRPPAYDTRMSQYPPPQYYAQPAQPAPQKGVSGFGIAALVIGIVSLLVAWVPVCGMAAMPQMGIQATIRERIPMTSAAMPNPLTPFCGAGCGGWA